MGVAGSSVRIGYRGGDWCPASTPSMADAAAAAGGLDSGRGCLRMGGSYWACAGRLIGGAPATGGAAVQGRRTGSAAPTGFDGKP